MTPDEIRKCSDEALSLWIAEKLSIQTTYKCSNAECTDNHDVLGLPSMVNDPAQSMMLLEKLLSMQIHFTFWPQSNGTVNMTLADGINPHWQVCATFRRAIAEAYALSVSGETK